MDKPKVYEPTLRRLLLVTSEDGSHMCLVPVTDTYLVEWKGTIVWKCICGQQIAASSKLLSWTTEYEPRCLNRFLHFKDEQKVTQ